MFQAALDEIRPNFPPGILQGDPRFSHSCFNMSDGDNIRGPWKEGRGPWKEVEWNYIHDPLRHVRKSRGLREEPIRGTQLTREEAERLNKRLSDERSHEVKQAVPVGPNQWSRY